MSYSVCNNTALEIPKGYLGSWEGHFQSTQKKKGIASRNKLVAI